MPGRRFLVALALSVAVHLIVVSNPAWRLPFTNAEPEMPALLEAQIVAPPKPAPPPPKPHSKPHPAAARAPVLLRAEPSDDASWSRSAPLAPPLPPEPVAPVPIVDAAPVPPPPLAPKVEMSWPRQGHIRFIVTRGQKGFMLGRSVHRWEHDETRYSIRTVTETVGLVAFFKPLTIVQTSVGDIGPTGLAPREFRVERDGKLAEGARFDFAAGRVTLTDGGRVRRDDTLVTGTQDLLSHIYQFGLMEKPQRFELMIATGKKYALYAYDFVGEETLATRFGDQRTLHYRTPPIPGEQTTEIWLAPDFHKLPVRIRFIDRDGDIYDQNADEIEIDGKFIRPRSGT